MRKLTTIALLSLGLLCGCPEDTGNKTAATGGDKGGAAKGGGDAKGGDTGKTTKTENWWKGVGVGTVVETEMNTDMKKPAEMKSKTIMRQTLKSKTDEGYILTTETETSGFKSPPTDAPIVKWEQPAGDSTAKSDTKDLGNESIKVGSDSFDCKHWQSVTDQAGVKTTTDTWMCNGLSVKSTSVNENMSMTMQVTKIEKK